LADVLVVQGIHLIETKMLIGIIRPRYVLRL
jgi:hypothetical protein